MKRRLLLPVLAVALVALLLWLDRGPAPAAYEAGEEAPSEAPDPELLTEAGTPEPAPGPQLAPTVPSPAAEPPRGDVRVVVLGTAGAPLPGVFVALRATSERGVGPLALVPGGVEVGSVTATDLGGEVVLKDVPWDGSMTAHVYRTDPRRAPNSLIWDPLPPQGHGEAARIVTGPRIVYRARTGLPLRLRVLSAETGSELDGVKIECHKARGTKSDPRAWQSAPHSYLVTPVVGQDWTLDFAVALRAGWVDWEPTWCRVTVSPYARALEFAYPMRREVPVTVLGREPDGGSVQAELSSLSVAGRPPRVVTWDGDAYRRLHIHGVPHLRDELVKIHVSREDGTGRVGLTAVIPEHPGARIDLETVLPKSEFVGPEDNGTIGIGGSSSSSFRSRSRRRYENEVRVTVRRRDGTPAVDALVRCARSKQRTDAQGMARLTNVVPGAHTVTVRQPGLLPLGGPVVVPEKGTVSIDLREGEGASLEVLVVDGQGRPLPFASLQVKLPSGLPWVDLDGEIQRIDPYTDHLGRREIGHLEGGALQVTASWGSRSVSRTMKLGAGRPGTLTIVLPRPQPPR